jgi:hypothetical protein
MTDHPPLNDAELERVRANLAELPPGINVAAADVGTLRRLLAEVDRLRAQDEQMETREEWAIRVENPDRAWWYHHESTGEHPEQDRALVLELLADSHDMAGNPVEHGPVSIVKRTVKESPWETVNPNQEGASS